jgi:transcriptional regulator with PAS, ATPase and Fis domain
MNTIQVHLPSLRERPEDIDELALYFLQMYGKKYNKPNLHIREDAMNQLRKNAWQGNIREFQHTMEKAVILSEKNELGRQDFYFGSEDLGIMEEAETLEDMEKKMIVSVLKKNDRNLTAAASQLGITRQTLYNKMKKYDL